MTAPKRTTVTQRDRTLSAEIRNQDALRKLGPTHKRAQSASSGFGGLTAIGSVEAALRARTLEEYDDLLRESRGKSSASEQQNRAFARYLSHGSFERRDMGYVTSSAGGYTVAPAFLPELMLSWQYASAIVSKSRVLHTPTGAQLTFPQALGDVSNVPTSVGENTQFGNNDFAAFTQVTFSETLPTIASDLVRIGRAVFNDSGVDVPSMVLDAYAQRMGRSVDKLAMTNALAAASVPTATTAANTGPTIDDLEALFFKLDAVNRNAPGAALIVSKATAATLRGLKDSSGRRILLDQTMTVQSDDFTLFGDAPLQRTTRFMSYAGVPILESPNIVDFSAGATFGLFANFAKFGITRVVDNSVGIEWLWERYADYAQVAAIGTGRFDYAVADYTAGCLWIAHA